MDVIDRELLNSIQKDFPICNRPFLKLAEKLGLSEKDIIKKIEKLKSRGLIRRLGGVFDSKKLGYRSTLCAAKVPPDRIAEVSEIINSFPGVTHNYLREHAYNMWFTLIAPSRDTIETNLAAIKEKTGVAEVINLPAENFFKIDVNFNLNEV